ncbi:lipid kinase [Phenylobacterium sp. J426]|uniref:lipid kinase n=1 Tax=Phenylobacterium sp. J426 TaxID=2898439 RepID=UPI0021510BF1|nr:lipid kinase [Phenylobacterium sp. J426]MCR5874635.1 lipid kinase [Phenylobacterium sp. J426]
MTRQALLVRNGGKPAAWLPPVTARLAGAGVVVRDFPTQSAEACRAAIAEEGSEADLVIVAGGDGTLAGAASALIEANRPMGILPLGTANDLARTLKIPADPVRAAEIIAAGRTRRIDLGIANGHPFFNVASVGLAADVADALRAEEKRTLGRFAYAAAAARVLIRARQFHAEIQAGSCELHTKSYQVAIGNGRYHGGGVAVREDAEIDDGQLMLYSLEPGSLWKVALLAPLFKRGEHVRWDEVRTATARSMTLRTDRPMPVNLDGDVVTETPLELSLLPKAVEVFAP